MARIYVASSWRNHLQPTVVERLRRERFEVYDFRNPAPGDNGFHWSEIDSGWREWTPQQFREAVRHPIAVGGFDKDMSALDAAHATVLVLPCGRSAHLELGQACGSGQYTYILMVEASEPELMYRMVDGIATTVDELVDMLRRDLEGVQ